MSATTDAFSDAKIEVNENGEIQLPASSRKGNGHPHPVGVPRVLLPRFISPVAPSELVECHLFQFRIESARSQHYRLGLLAPRKLPNLVDAKMWAGPNDPCTASITYL